MNKTMLTNKLTGGLTASLSALLIAAACVPEASAIDYTTKAINAYDHNGKLISTQIASDVQYIEVEDLAVEPVIFTVNGIGFKMIPVIGTNSYKLKASNLSWPELEKYAPVNTFYLGETEVTNALWKAVMGTVPSKISTEDDFPVESVSWNEICKVGGFLDKLNEVVRQDAAMAELMEKYEFCLPNEWEWEYAAGGGNLYEGFPYSGSSNLDEVAWYAGNSGNTTHKVATQSANGLGIYDMTGNVWEWCSEDKFRNADGTYNLENRPNRGRGYSSESSLQYVNRGLGNAADRPQTFVGLRLALKEKGLKKLVFAVTASDGTKVSFNMIPVAGPTSYKLKASKLQWPDDEKYAVVSSFYIGETEVTNALWKAVMNTETPSQKNTGDNFPVESVSWNDICKAGGFLEKLNDMLEQNPDMKALMNGRKFCLPSEWEWEYAAGGGNLYEGFRYAGSNAIDDVAWYGLNSGNTTHEVATKKPNGLGIYDMSGNVWEWCREDKFRTAEGTYNTTLRPNRGWSYATELTNMGYINRGQGNAPASANDFVGLRLVLK